MTRARQRSSEARRPRGTGGPQRLHTSPYLLKPLRSLEQATRDAEAKADDEAEE